MRIDELPEPYQHLVRKRANPIKHLGAPLISAFSWADTPEGNAFWRDVYMAKTVEDLPEIPQKEKVA